MKPSEKDAVIASIVDRVADYREGEIAPIDATGVHEWLRQFDLEDRPTILGETARLLSKFYITKKVAKNFIRSLSLSAKLAGDSPKRFWREVGFLRLQRGSRSQSDMLALLDKVLEEEFSLSTESSESAAGVYIYLDDGLYTGNQLINDIKRWAESDNIRDATVHVIAMVTHSSGTYWIRKALTELRTKRGIELKYWNAVQVENSPNETKKAQVYWPVSIPDDEHVNKWKQSIAPERRNFMLRTPGGAPSSDLFSSEAARHTVEQAFLKKGAYIWGLAEVTQRSMRPLGFHPLQTPGFGATVITYRNCPNNAPLVLWWGDPNGVSPLDGWTPLLPRRSRQSDPGSDFDDIIF